MNLPTHFVVNFAIVIDRKVLLEKEVGGSWKLPGGHIENNETPSDTVMREAKEELGVNVEIIFSKPLFDEGPKAYSLPSPFEMFCHQVDKDNNLNVPHRNIGLVYLTTTDGEPKSQEGQEIKLFSQAELEAEEMSPAVKKLSLKALEILNKNFNS